MTVIAGLLVFVTVDYFRTARYRTRHQVESHRTPRYHVRYQLDGQPAHEAIVGFDPSQGLVGRIRGSRPGDMVEVLLARDGKSIVGWINKTEDELWRDFDGTWGESD